MYLLPFEPPSHFPPHPTLLGWNRAPIWVRKLFLKVGVGAVGWVEFSHLTCWRWALRSQELSEEPIMINFSFFLAPWSGKTQLRSLYRSLMECLYWHIHLSLEISDRCSHSLCVSCLRFPGVLSLCMMGKWEGPRSHVSATLSSLLSTPYHLGHLLLCILLFGLPLFFREVSSLPR